MARWTEFFKLVDHNTKKGVEITDNTGSSFDYGNYSWYKSVIGQSARRLNRNKQYAQMAGDTDIARALDTIAEEITGNADENDLPLLVSMSDDNTNTVNNIETLTIKAALRYWCEIHDWHTKLFSAARQMILFGDCFFEKDDKNPNKKWTHIPALNVFGAIVNPDDASDVQAWVLNTEQQKTVSAIQQPVQPVKPADTIVRFTLNDSMSESAPFGVSVLSDIYKTFQQKELLESSIIIYRIQRAPEKRVFYIDVGKMPPQRAKQYLEQMKNEIKSKKVPTMLGDAADVDSIYNPAGMCLALDTKIPLLDGRVLPLSELIVEHETGKQNWAYSVDPTTGNRVPGKISWAGVTRRNAKTIRLTFDDGKHLVLTPDHKIPVIGKGFKEAKDITPEDEMFAYDKLKTEVQPRKLFNFQEDVSQDVGTLTIDKDHEHHDYHTFAAGETIFVRNCEDFFVANRSDGRGSKIETLPSGSQLGEVADLLYFEQKMWRGLRIPPSYMQGGRDGQASYSDGKVGTAYILELRFSLYIQRLQTSMEMVLDKEFKRYLHLKNIHVDTTNFKLKLPVPSNFGVYRQQELDAQLLNTFGSADNIKYLSKRFILKRYLNLTDEEVAENDRLRRMEMGLDPDGGETDLVALYGQQEGGEGGDLGGGLPGSPMGNEPINFNEPGGDELGGLGAPGGAPPSDVGGTPVPATEPPPPD